LPTRGLERGLSSCSVDGSGEDHCTPAAPPLNHGAQVDEVAIAPCSSEIRIEPINCDEPMVSPATAGWPLKSVPKISGDACGADDAAESLVCVTAASSTAAAETLQESVTGIDDSKPPQVAAVARLHDATVALPLAKAAAYD